MSREALTFGRNLMAAATVAEALQLEDAAGKSAQFGAVDALLSEIITGALGGGRTVEVERGRQKDRVHLVLDDQHRATADELFALSRQQARGAWYLPEKATVAFGALRLMHAFRTYPGHASAAVTGDFAYVSLGDAPDHLLLWAATEPLFVAIGEPLALRGPDRGTLSASEEDARWAEIDSFYEAVGLDAAAPLAILRDRASWARLGRSDRFAAKVHLLETIARSLDATTGRRVRLRMQAPLLTRFYQKSKKGSAPMRSVLTKPMQRVLSAFFGGDWLAFLSYLGESPAASEQITTALPAPTLYVDINSRATAVAVEQGLPIEEIERIVAAFWGEAGGVSPVAKRVAALRSYWAAFDALHARQLPGMKSLWGLVSEERQVHIPDPPESDDDGYGRYQPGLHRSLLPEQLSADVESLWDTTFSERWPERVVTNPYPHTLMAETFGPALRFWHGCALTAWFICEGPYSRTDMKGLARYHEADLAELAALGYPVSPALFEELIAAEARLGDRVPSRPPDPPKVVSVVDRIIQGFKVTITSSTSPGVPMRRIGFERLRDIITRHRRAWASTLDAYLGRRWEDEVRSAATGYYQLLASKGRSPTIREFLRYGATPANHWFGGSFRDLLGAFGEKGPSAQERARFVPHRATEFAVRLLRALGSRPTTWAEIAATIQGNDRTRQDEEWRAYGEMKRLAEFGVDYLQAMEALGRAPTVKEFGEGRFARLGPRLAPSIPDAWARYTHAIEQVRTAMSQ